jgi:methionyl-tRNA formyltransferase
LNKRIGILASGGLGESVLRSLSVHPAWIATDSASSGIIAFAAAAAIPLFKGNPRQGRLAAFLAEHPADLLLSVNYLFLLEEDVLHQVPDRINFHGSLLPRYRGRTPHVWAIINNETAAGITAHVMETGCDTGDIVLQELVPIGEEDTGADLLRAYADRYPHLVNRVVQLWMEGGIERRPQDHGKASFFGKRGPEDGGINWNWQRERIRNWVRAQAAPYPGAFTQTGDEKIVIDRVAYSDAGFSWDMPNGLVLASGPAPLIKTPNGALELVSVRSGLEHLKSGLVLESI